MTSQYLKNVIFILKTPIIIGKRLPQLNIIYHIEKPVKTMILFMPINQRNSQTGALDVLIELHFSEASITIKPLLIAGVAGMISYMLKY